MEKSKTKKSTKLFFSGVLVLTISNLIIKVIGVLFKIPMNRLVGDQGMGYYSSAYTIYTFFYMVSTAGLPVAISLLVSENRAKGRLKQVKKVFKLSLLLFLIIGFVGAAIMILGAHGFSAMLKSDPSYWCIVAVAPTLFFICISSALRGYFQGYQFMVPVAISQLIEALCKLFLGIAFASYAISRYGADKAHVHIVAGYAVLGVTIGAGLGMVFLLFSKMLFKSNKYDAEYLEDKSEDDYTEPSGKILKNIALIALPITISASVMSLTNLIDMTLIQRLLQSFRGMTEAQATSVYGNYTSLCVPMFNLPPYLIYPISYSIVPLIKTAVSAGDRDRANLVMTSSLRVAVLIGIPCGLGMSALAGPILHMFGYRYWSVVSATPLLMLLAPSTFFICVLSVSNAILQANGYERKPVISMLVGAAVKVVPNMILIRVIGMEGTPISTFLCYLTATGLNIYFVIKYVGLKIKFTSIFVRPLIAGVLCALVALGVCNFSSGYLSNSIRYEYTDTAEGFVIEGPYRSSYLHHAEFLDDGTATDTRSDLVVEKSESGDELTLNDSDGNTYKITYEDGKTLVDGIPFDVVETENQYGWESILSSDTSALTITLSPDEEGLTGTVVEEMTYKMEDGKLSLTYPEKTGSTLKLSYKET
ncbi:MAG: polysaccharide biosynthesis protein, partial [Clostridia bacterium]|nr:polysaccharide biosynthesis protein [Clostridia bacterium]